MSTYTRRINLYINGEEVQHDIKSIRAEVTKLERTIKIATIGSKEYNDAMRRIQTLQPILNQHNAQLKQTSVSLLSMKGMANAFNKFMPLVMGGIGAFYGLAFGVTRAAQEFGAFDDKVADVMKVTQMSRDQVIALNEELKKIDTRSAQNTLLDLSFVAGKLGISAQEDVLGFVRAADKISVALAKDLGGNAEEALRAIGKAVNIFRLDEVYGIEEAMLRVGSAINDLGMASVAQEGYLVKFIERVAGIAPLAGVSIENVLGLAAALDMVGQTSEVAATAYSQIMTKMATESETMARIAGVSIEEWTTLFSVDANEALMVLLESIRASGAGVFNELVNSLGYIGLEGERMIRVMGAMVASVDTIREQQEIANRATKENVSITNEFNIKNNNAQAIIEKKQKSLQILRVELGEKLFPVYIKGMTVLEIVIKTIGVLIEFFNKHGRVILSVITALTAYHAIFFVLNNLSLIYTKTTTALQWALLKTKIAYYQLTGASIAALAAQTKLNAIVAKNPYVKLASVILAAAAALAVYFSIKNRLSATDQAHINIQKELGTQYNELAANVERLTGIIEDENLSHEKRKTAIEELKKIMPGYNGMLSEEGRLISHNVSQIDEWLAGQEQRIRALIIEEEVIKLIRKRITAEEDLVEQQEKLEKHKAKIDINALTQGGEWERTGFAVEKNLDSRILNRINRDITKLKQDIEDYNDAIQELGVQRVELQPLTGKERMLAEIKAIENALRRLTEGDYEIKIKDHSIYTGAYLGAEFIDQFDEARIERLRNRLAELNKIINQPRGGTDGWNNVPAGERFSEEAEGRALLALRQQFARDQQEVNRRMHLGITETDELYQNIRFKNEQEYNDRVLKTQINFAQGRLMSADRMSENYLGLQVALSEKILELAKKENQQVLALRKSGVEASPFDKAKQEYINQLTTLGIFHADVEKLTSLQHEALTAETDKYLAEIDKINADHFKDHFDTRIRNHEYYISLLQLQHANELSEIQTLAQAREYLSKYMSQQELLQVTTLGDARKAIIEKQESEIAAIQKRFFEGLITQLQSIFESMEFDYFDPLTPEAFLSDQTRDEIITRLKAIIEEYRKLVNAIKEENPTERIEKLRRIDMDIFGFAQDDWESFFKNIDKAKWETGDLQDIMLMATKAIANAWSDVNTIIANIEDRRLQQYKKNNEEQLKSLEGRFQSGLISEEYYQGMREKLAVDLDRKQAQIARKQAARDKAVALFNAIVNTALAITKALATIPPPLNFVMAGLVAAAGALQVGVIASQPMPQIPGYEHGGYIDVERAQDGKEFNALYAPHKRGFVHEPTVITGENGTEYVIPEEGVNNPYLQPIIQQIENARKTGTLSYLNPLARQSVVMPGKQQGGHIQTQPSVVNNIGADRDTDGFKELLLHSNKIMDGLKKEIERGVVAYVSLTGRKGFFEAEKEFNRLSKNANL